MNYSSFILPYAKKFYFGGRLTFGLIPSMFFYPLFQLYLQSIVRREAEGKSAILSSFSQNTVVYSIGQWWQNFLLHGLSNFVFLAYSGRYTVGSFPLHDASRAGLVLCSILRNSPDPVPNALYTNVCCFPDSAFVSQRLPSTFVTPSVLTQMMASHHTSLKHLDFFRSSPFYNGCPKVSYRCR